MTNCKMLSTGINSSWIYAGVEVASPADAFRLVFALLPTSTCLPEDVIPFPPLSQSQGAFTIFKS